MSNVPRNLLLNWDVLIVEDDFKSLDIADRILSGYGANVYVASNGEDALIYLEVIQPRFILSDLSMPVMDGWQLIEKLKHNPKWADIPIFALTAHAMIGDREKALSAGFHNYMTKPFTVETFIDKLVTLLEGVPGFNLRED